MAKRGRFFKVVLVVGALVMALSLVVWNTMPALKAGLKERWHRGRCPEVPVSCSARSAEPQGGITYLDPAPFAASGRQPGPNLHFDFDRPGGDTSLLTRDAFSGAFALRVENSSPAILRYVGDVSDSLVAITAGFMMKSMAEDPDTRIVIRLDRADGTLIEWNEKRLRADEHVPGEWERFNFEWLLRDLRVESDARAEVFVLHGAGEELLLDAMDVVFRSDRPLKSPSSVR